MDDDFKVPCLPTVKPVPIVPEPVVKTEAEKNHDIEIKSNEEEKLIEQILWEPKCNAQVENQKAISTLTATQIECCYKEPNWSQKPSSDNVYKFEVLKSGQIVDEIPNLETHSFWVFGRLPDNHIPMAHPTVSRYHAVLQYRPKCQDVNDELSDDGDKKQKIKEGWYIYDLGSTHGTFLNKIRCPPKTYIRVRVGHMLKLGASSRSFILQGPDFDEEPESELSITELKELRKQKQEEELTRQKMQEEMREKEGISWGMSEDADEETDLNVNPYATTNNEELFLDDPKKTLRGFFEREGLNLEYKCDEMSPGTFVCRIELPLDDSNGKPIIAEVCLKGKKKECVVQCALEACRILDRHGILRQSHHEPLKRKIKSDSDDEDDFLDRTGDVERKKLRKVSTANSTALTYEDLLKQEKEVGEKMKITEESILKYQKNSSRIKKNKQNAEDDLDSFMDNLTEDAASIDKVEIRKLRVEELRLKLENQNIQKLLRIAKPLDLSKISSSTSAEHPDLHKKKLALPLFGKRNKFKFTPISRMEVKKVIQTENKSDEEEVELDEMDMVTNHNESEEEITLSSVSGETYGPAITPNNKEGQQNDKKVDANIQSKIEKVEIVEKEEDKVEKEEDNVENEEHKIENISEWVSEKTVDKTEDISFAKNTIESTSSAEETNLDQTSELDDDSAKTKKHRVRVRNRNRRENIDIDDYAEFEDSDKHAEWVPPVNQKGDGFTKLNDKFGY